MRFLSLPLVRRATASPPALRLTRCDRRLSPAMRRWVIKTLVAERLGNVEGPAGARRGDFRVELLNPWIDQPLTNLSLRLDGRELDPTRLRLDDGRGPRALAESTAWRFDAVRPLAIIVRGGALGDGLHFLGVRLTGAVAPLVLPDVPLLMSGGVGRLLVAEGEPAPPLTAPGESRFFVHYAPHFVADADWFADEPMLAALAGGGLRAALRLLEKDARATFILTHAASLEALRGGGADALPRLAALARQGRAEAAMAFATEPAVCWVSGESLVRQAVTWQRLCQQAFGAPSAVAWLTRADGLPATLPQILRKAGCRAIAFTHAAEAENAPPIAFRWEGLDGARLKAHWLRKGPAIGFPISQDRDVAPPRLEAAARTLAAGASDRDLLCPAGSIYGKPPERLAPLLEEATAASAAFEFAPSLPSRYFAALPDRRLPIVTGEFPSADPPLARPELRRLHREAEAALLGAERLARIAGERFSPDRRASLAGAWDLLMRAQTRAALSGAHVDAVSARLTEALRKVLKIADREASSALSRLADVVRTPRGALSALVVANPSGFAREQVVAFEVEAVDGRWPALTDGRRRLPYQIQRVSSEAAGSRARAVFLASLPALAFRAYWLVAGGTALPVAPERAVTTAGENRLRNGWLTALLDPQSGAVASVVHRARDRVYPLGDLGVLVVAAAPRPGARRRAEVWTFAAEGQDILEGGPIAAALRVNGRLGPSRASLTYRVSQATRSIAVEGFVDFVEPCGALDVLFPRPGGAERLVHEIPYGAIARGEGEFPALGFVDLSAADHGLTLLGDGFATCRVEAKRIGLRVGGSLARVHELAETGAPLIGPCAFRYALFPREGAADAAGLHRRSEDFRSPFFVWQGPPGQARGCRAKRTVGAALELSTEAIEVGALYDDDDGATILRLIERCGRRIEARIRPRWRYRRAETTDLLGRPAQPLKPRRWPTRWGELELFFRPFEIKTLRLT